MGKHVHVQELPGIGKKYDLGATQSGQRIAVIVHRDGSKELYAFDGKGDEPAAVFTLDEKQGRMLGAVLTDTYFTDD